MDEELGNENKDRLLVYLQRLKRNEEKHKKKHKRIKKKIKILKERIVHIENQEWMEQLQDIDRN